MDQSAMDLEEAQHDAEIAAEFADLERRKDDQVVDKFNIASDEDAEKELALFLESLDKNDLGSAIKLELRKKLEAATSKLATIFDKQRALLEEEEDDQEANLLEAQSKTASATAVAEESRTNRKAEQAKNVALTKKNSVLSRQVQLAEQKSRSVTVQWTQDKIRHKEDRTAKLLEISELEARLLVMEKKARLSEQVIRDRNMVRGPTGTIETSMEDGMEKLRQELEEKIDQLAEKRSEVRDLALKLSDARLELSNAEMRVETQTHRIEDLVKNSDSLHNSIDGLEKEEGGMAKAKRMVDAELAEARHDLVNEQKALADLEKQLVQQNIDFEARIEAMDVSALKARVQGLVEQQDTQRVEAQGRERDLRREMDSLVLEKQQIVRESGHFSAAMKSVASMTRSITADFDNYRDSAQSRIDAEAARVARMYDEVTKLTLAVDSLGGDAVQRSKEMGHKMEEIKHRADMAAANFEREREQLQLRVVDLQKEATAREKAVDQRIISALALAKENSEGVGKELSTAKLVIDRLNIRLGGVQREGSSIGAGKDAAVASLQEVQTANDELTKTVAKLQRELEETHETMVRMKEEQRQWAEDKKELESNYDDIRAQLKEKAEALDEMENRMGVNTMTLLENYKEQNKAQERANERQEKAASTNKEAMRAKEETVRAKEDTVRAREELSTTKKELISKYKELKSVVKKTAK
ncbi:hypothetical protein B484DRAFT_438265, partial [Ochromonadaceae sp. CCMP2298]